MDVCGNLHGDGEANQWEEEFMTDVLLGACGSWNEVRRVVDHSEPRRYPPGIVSST